VIQKIVKLRSDTPWLRIAG